jgi:hypothetical protein
MAGMLKYLASQYSGNNFEKYKKTTVWIGANEGNNEQQTIVGF